MVPQIPPVDAIDRGAQEHDQGTRYSRGGALTLKVPSRAGATGACLRFGGGRDELPYAAGGLHQARGQLMVAVLLECVLSALLAFESSDSARG